MATRSDFYSRKPAARKDERRFSTGSSPAVPSSRYNTLDYKLYPRLRVELVVDGGVVKAFQAETPQDEIERYLPPPGEYHDLPSLNYKFPEKAFDKLNCTSCWWIQHYGKCDVCRVCDEGNHGGEICPMLYLSFKFWRERGRMPTADVQLRPTEKELAYLIVAGVFLYKPGMHFWNPLVINNDHPIVRKMYSGKEAPRKVGKSHSSFTIEGYGVYPLPAPATSSGIANVNGGPSNLPASAFAPPRPLISAPPPAPISAPPTAPTPAPPPALLSVRAVRRRILASVQATQNQSASVEVQTIAADAVQPTALGADAGDEEHPAGLSDLSDDESLPEGLDDEDIEFPADFGRSVSREYFDSHTERKDNEIANLRKRKNDKIKELKNEDEAKQLRIRKLQARGAELEGQERSETTREETNKRARLE